MQAKIKELYKASQQSQAAMMNQGGSGSGEAPLGYPGLNPYNPYMSMYSGAALGSLQGRNPFTTGTAAGTGSAGNFSLYGSTAAATPQYSMSQQLAAASAAAAVVPPRSVPVHPEVKLVKLPFYDVHGELLRPASLLAQGNTRVQEAQFQFFLTPQQATDIASNRDISLGLNEYLYQVSWTK